MGLKKDNAGLVQGIYIGRCRGVPKRHRSSYGDELLSKYANKNDLELDNER